MHFYSIFLSFPFQGVHSNHFSHHFSHHFWFPLFVSLPNTWKWAKTGPKMATVNNPITDFGELHWILGIEVKRIRERCTIHLSQWSYIDSMLWRYGFDDIKPVSLLSSYGSLHPTHFRPITIHNSRNLIYAQHPLSGGCWIIDVRSFRNMTGYYLCRSNGLTFL